MWCEDFDDNDFLIRWRHAYQKRMVQKSKVKEQLMPLPGVHQDGGIDACQKKKKKRGRKIVEINRTFFCLVTRFWPKRNKKR